MKRLLVLIIGLFLIGCEDTREPECGDCGFDVYSTSLPQLDNGDYILEINANLAQTYTKLDVITECGWSQHIQWDTDYMYNIQGSWVSLVNPGSMTDENGDASVMFAAWEEFIGFTVTVYGGYIDPCGTQQVDSLKIQIVDNE